MVRRRHKLDPHSNTERWLLTYADLVTLLLAFFIVMYSMSRIDDSKFGRMAHAFNGVLRGDQAGAASSRADLAGAILLNLGELQTLAEQIQSKVESERLEEGIETTQDERGLVIRVLESAAFDEGSADLKPQMHSILNLLATELLAMDNHLRVEGHTDDRPIKTMRYPSNWELSTNRATGVVRYLVEQLHMDPTRVSALGYGEFRPIASNENAVGRARNRRVDLIVLADKSAEPASGPQSQDRPLVMADSLPGR